MGEFLLEVCSGRAAWQVQPQEISTIDMAGVSKRIIESGWICTLENRLCFTFTGEVDMTLFPSGKLLVKTADKKTAEKIAEMHVNSWLS